MCELFKMLRVLSGVFVVLFYVCTLKVSADRDVLPQLRRLRLKDLFSTREHYKENEHNEEFDHDAFLGEEIAHEWEKLPVAEVKEKLRALFPKVDIDNDNQVSMTELYGWIEQHMKKHVLHGTDARMRELDTNKDGKLSWEEYRVVEFPPQLEEGLTDPILTELREIIMRDKRRFEFSDTDSDNMLSQEELTFFLHPEESKRMTSYLVKENLDAFDKNKDGKVTLEEYLVQETQELSKSTRERLTKSFKEELDKNHDGYLDEKEMRHWVLPGVDEDPIQSEADHLMKLGDDNRDNMLSVEEIVKHHRVFAGSRVTKYGDLLKEEL